MSSVFCPHCIAQATPGWRTIVRAPWARIGGQCGSSRSAKPKRARHLRSMSTAAGQVEGAAASAPASASASATADSGSIFQGDPDAPVYDVPIAVISRPIPSVLDASKVDDFVCKLKEGTKLTPIEVAWVEHEGNNYYFAFGGCHRWAAHKQLGSETIPARLIKMAPSDISIYLGASSPFRKKS